MCECSHPESGTQVKSLMSLLHLESEGECRRVFVETRDA